MIKRRRFPRVFFGWWMVLASGILALWGHGYYSYGFSALFKPISSELGFSRAGTSVAAGIGRLEGGVEAPLTGWIADRFGPKWIVLFGVFLIGLGLLLMNYINSLWAFYVAWGIILGTGLNIALTLPLEKAIAEWFVKKRGLALGIRSVFSGLSGVLVLPLIAWLITVQGWRMTVVIGGLIMWSVGLPLAWFFLKRHRPEYYGLLPDGATVAEEFTASGQMIDRGVEYAAEVDEVEFTLRQAMKTRAYWLLIVANGFHSLAIPAINIHGIPFLTDIGIEPLRAAGMMAMMIATSLPSRFLGGLLSDRIRKNQLRFLLGGAYLLQAMGFAIYLLNPTIAMIYLWFILYGLGMGVGFALMAPMKARYFGRKAYGSITGLARGLMTPIGIVTPIYLGWVYDTKGSYISAFASVAALLAFAGVLAFFFLPPKLPAEVTDIRKFV
ncbi:MAG: MFS transporter [Chloroflexi bacterium]|nr:MFS transporter [Chloroflexota bacterium]